MDLSKTRRDTFTFWKLVRLVLEIWLCCTFFWEILCVLLHCFSLELITDFKVPQDQWGNQCILNTLRPRPNGRRFADDIFKRIFFNENVWIPIQSSLKFVPKGPINNIPALDRIMAWCRPGDKPLSEPMMARLPTHICVTRLQWVKQLWSTIICTVTNTQGQKT